MGFSGGKCVGKVMLAQVPCGLYRETYSVLIEWLVLKKTCRPDLVGWRLTDAGFRVVLF